jgi:hypothetical protein
VTEQKKKLHDWIQLNTVEIREEKKNSTEAANSREPPSLVLEREREREGEEF